jgi:hypothetical protein
MKFAEVMARTPGIELMAYGPLLHKGYPGSTSLPYHPNATISDIKSHFPFDCIIMNTKSRMWLHYDPHRNESQGCWVPRGTEHADVPRIVIEEDYHYEKDDIWYREQNIDLILQRHYSQSLRQDVVPMRWLPFSVDVDVFKPNDEIPRIPMIGFAGSSNCSAYQIRERACNELNKHRLVRVFNGPSRRTGMGYVECLQQYLGHISCSSTFRLSTAKMFEIMASGSVLLTNRNDDLPLLFPDNTYCPYSDDGTDVVKTAQSLIDDPGYAKNIADLGRKCILERHSHQIRINQLLAHS